MDASKEDGTIGRLVNHHLLQAGYQEARFSFGSISNEQPDGSSFAEVSRDTRSHLGSLAGYLQSNS
ncbi:hypothetical protein EXN66_Car000186 [Channa argus]|uniref:Uncharacterized protein n=1 Tax=Channa argus TaxID=215402 RepID=A0A6G1QWY7_CHAAH|nr:hypothetical protein EXN66_Car000186 [Channa argus]